MFNIHKTNFKNKVYGKKKHLFNYHDGYHGFWYCIDLQFMGIMEGMANNLGNGYHARSNDSRRINSRIYKRKYILIMVTLVIMSVFQPTKNETQGKKILETVMATVLCLAMDSLYIIPIIYGN